MFRKLREAPNFSAFLQQNANFSSKLKHFFSKLKYFFLKLKVSENRLTKVCGKMTKKPWFNC